MFSQFESKTYYYHQLFDKYNTYSNVNNIKTINDHAGKTAVKVDSELIELLQLAHEYYVKSNGKFDFTLDPVLKIWHDAREKALNNELIELPTQEQLKAAKTCSGWDKVKIDDENNTVYLSETCASLDVGAIAKGFAAEKVAKYMEELGVDRGFINAGGNIKIIGNKMDESAWRVGINVPIAYATNESIGSLLIEDSMSMVTSGDYQRFFVYNDEIYHHIIDSDTLFPAKDAKSVTVLTKNSALADALSTWLYTVSYQEGNKIIKQLNDEGTSCSAIWIYDDLVEIKDTNYQIAQNFYVIVSDNIVNDISLEK